MKRVVDDVLVDLVLPFRLEDIVERDRAQVWSITFVDHRHTKQPMFTVVIGSVGVASLDHVKAELAERLLERELL